MRKIQNKNKKGYLIWLTGISGSGKSTIAKKIYKSIKKKLGPTILINGDDLRDIFDLKTYENYGRKKIATSYTKLSKFLTNQKINVIFATVSMYHEVRRLNRLNLNKRYIEIFIDTELKNILKNKKKKLYFSKKKNIVGREIKPQYPKNPDIKIKNDFKKNLQEISDEILKRIFKKI